MENKNTMRNSIIENNKFLSNMAVVSVFGVTSDEEVKVYNIFSRTNYFTGLRKSQENKKKGYIF